MWIYDWWRFRTETSVDEQAKFDYSPMGNVFNKRLTEEDKKKDFIREYKILKIRLKAKIKNN